MEMGPDIHLKRSSRGVWEVPAGALLKLRGP